MRSQPLYFNRDFLSLMAAQGLSVSGREIGVIVLPLLVLAIAESTIHVGLVAAFQALPYLLFGLPAGALVDRWDRKQTMLICELVRVAALLSVPIVWWIGDLLLVHLYLVAVVTGTAFVFYNIAEISALPQVVDRSRLTQATSIGNAVEWIGELSGINKALVPGEPGARLNLRSEISEGIDWMRSKGDIAWLAVLAMMLNTCFAPVSICMIVLATNHFDASPLAIGLLFSIAGVTGLAGTLIAPGMDRRFAPAGIIVTAVSIWALALLSLPLSGSIWVLGLGWAVVTAVGGVYDVIATSYRLTLTPDGVQGRVNSVFRLFAFGIRPVSLAAGGVLIALLGARETLWMIAVGMMLTAVTAMVGAGRLRLESTGRIE